MNGSLLSNQKVKLRSKLIRTGTPLGFYCSRGTPQQQKSTEKELIELQWKYFIYRTHKGVCASRANQRALSVLDFAQANEA